MLLPDRGQLSKVKYLVESRINIEIKGGNLTRTPLRPACHGGHIEVVKYLISKGADIHSPDEDSLQPLHFAARQGYRLLLSLNSYHIKIPSHTSRLDKMIPLSLRSVLSFFYVNKLAIILNIFCAHSVLFCTYQLRNANRRKGNCKVFQ